MASQLFRCLSRFRYVYNIRKYEDARYLVSAVDICSLGRPVMEIPQVLSFYKTDVGYSFTLKRQSLMTLPFCEIGLAEQFGETIAMPKLHFKQMLFY
jgi:hypothetical protein